MLIYSFIYNLQLNLQFKVNCGFEAALMSADDIVLSDVCR